MESNTAKRRKLDHANGYEASSSTLSMGASGASAFVLETEELLKEVKLDYSKSSSGVEDSLRQLKDIIEALEPHEPVPVSLSITPMLRGSGCISLVPNASFL